MVSVSSPEMFQPSLALFHLVVSCNTNCTISFKTSLLQITAAMPKQNVSVCLLIFQVFYKKNSATGETSQAITPFHFFDYSNFYRKITLFIILHDNIV